MALRQELQQKGISRSIIDQALAASDETAAARMAAEKKARQLTQYPEDEFKKKLGQFLQRRGFSYALIDEIIDELWQETEQNLHLERSEASSDSSLRSER
jgi:regulatory protein